LYEAVYFKYLWKLRLAKQTQAIDDVHRAVSEATDKEVQEEGKTLVAAIAKLKYELQHDRKLT
jgi:hypothetical protein